jgi:hypothetical protein
MWLELGKGGVHRHEVMDLLSAPVHEVGPPPWIGSPHPIRLQTSNDERFDHTEESAIPVERHANMIRVEVGACARMPP